MQVGILQVISCNRSSMCHLFVILWSMQGSSGDEVTVQEYLPSDIIVRKDRLMWCT